MEILTEYNFRDMEVLTEYISDGIKNWYLHGIYAQAEVINRNKRVYPSNVLDESMQEYIENYVDMNRGYGELQHADTMVINPDRISHRIVELHKDGNNYIGKAKILNTPTGKIVQALLEDTKGIGMSTRATGNTKKRSNGIVEVTSPLKMKCVDIVLDNSAPDAFCTAIMESAPWLSTIQEASEEFLESIKQDLDKNSAYKLQENKIEAWKKFMKHITENVK